MPVNPLPSNPHLDHLKQQARDLLKLRASADLAVAQRIREFLPGYAAASDFDIFAAPLKLNDAHLIIARERGFKSWTRLRKHVLNSSQAGDADLYYVERIEDAALRRAVHLLDAGDREGLRLHLKEHPDVTHGHALFEGGNYFRTPTLLEFVAENPIRNGRLPENIVELAELIIGFGVESAALNQTLLLVSTGSVPRDSKVQIPLIDLLCDHAADPDSALRPAAAHGEHAAVEALIGRGARLDLPVAAALGRMDEFRRLFPIADAHDRHLALALASQFGHTDIARLLLDAGEDPNRYNPAGSHSHSTPLHQAALAGHESVVRLLVELGARLDIKDVLWSGTPADWARHEGRLGLAAYLTAEEPASAAKKAST